MLKIAILMYHRICEPTKNTSCYFARGTAVEPNIFAEQIQSLGTRYKFISLTQASESIKKKETGNYCVITFDDGYKEIQDFAWPLCQKMQIPICLFPIAGHTAESERPAYVDHYYTILQNAQKRRNIHLKCLEIAGIVPDIDQNINWWTKGPLKEKIHQTTALEQPFLLAKICDLLDSHVSSDLPQKLYLSKVELRQLFQEGVEIGGHGYYHRRLAHADNNELKIEMEGTIRLLQEIGIQNPNLFCYPDGSYSPHVQKTIAGYGFDVACTVHSDFCGYNSVLNELPRIFMRNIASLDDKWCHGL